MRIVLASLFALTIGSTIHGAQAASDNSRQAEQTGRWCSIGLDNARHCYFRRHQDCMKAISDGSGVCVPNEARRGEMPEDPRK
jgi:hypothetical protein